MVTEFVTIKAKTNSVIRLKGKNLDITLIGDKATEKITKVQYEENMDVFKGMSKSVEVTQSKENKQEEVKETKKADTEKVKQEEVEKVEQEKAEIEADENLDKQPVKTEKVKKSKNKK